jgi:hypothetical protein
MLRGCFGDNLAVEIEQIQLRLTGIARPDIVIGLGLGL